jgi:hypothetical protein
MVGRLTRPDDALKLLLRSKWWYCRGATTTEAVADSTVTHCTNKSEQASTAAKAITVCDEVLVAPQ